MITQLYLEDTVNVLKGLSLGSVILDSLRALAHDSVIQVRWLTIQTTLEVLNWQLVGYYHSDRKARHLKPFLITNAGTTY